MAGILEYLGRAGKQVVPAMKEVFGERVPNPALEGPAGSTAKVASKAASKVGPAAGLIAAYEGGSALNEAFNPMVRIPKIEKGVSELRASKWAQENPEAATKGTAYGKDVSDRASQAGILAVKQGADQYKSEAAQGKYPIFKDMKQDVALVKSAPPEVESKRMVLESGAKEQLRTNQLSRPKAAEEVVKADIARSGEEVRPEEYKARVAEETAAMKTMDDDQLSKYLSYALIAGGLVASYFDEDAGRAFASSLNNQLDREQQERLFNVKQKQAADQAQAEAALKQQELGMKAEENRSKQEDRAADNAREERKLGSLVEKWANEADMAQKRLDVSKQRNAIEAGKSSGKEPVGPYLTASENQALVKSYYDAKGLDLGEGVTEAAAQQLQFIQKQYPDLTVQEQMELIEGQFNKTPAQKAPWYMGGDTDPSLNLQ